MKLGIMAAAAVLAGFAALTSAEDVSINTVETEGRLVDDINLPFADDPAVLGEWRSVDFVAEPSAFSPGAKRFRGELYLGGFRFFPGGKMGVLPNAPESAPWFGWTRGVVMHLGGDHTASRYTIKEIGGSLYMFFEWKSGDYIIRHRKPQYYVLRKTE